MLAVYALSCSVVCANNFTPSHAVSHIRLGHACERKDICQDENSMCLQGTCKCSPGYKKKEGACGKQSSMSLYVWLFILTY